MNKIRFVSYNIDGLPDKLDLRELPWIFKSVYWVYKMIKKTQYVTINDGVNRAENTKKISEYLNSLNADVIAVQEDFNYHNELMSSLEGYIDSTHTGDISLNKLFSKTEWRPLPRFKADGLNLITNTSTTTRAGEKIVRWDKSNGYVGSANDKLTHKGFRYYLINVNNCPIDLYILHMDADFYNPETCPDVTKDAEARKSQMIQLLSYINEKKSDNPIVIVGDTNMVDSLYTWDVDTVKMLYENGFVEAKADVYDVDRLFYKNNHKSMFTINAVNAKYGNVWLSDHRPLIVDLEVDINV